MELTELEFENLLQLSFKDEANVPDELNQRLMKKIYQKSRYKRILKSVPLSAAACLIVGVMVVSVISNNGNKTSDEFYQPIAVNETNYAVTMDLAREEAQKSIPIDNRLVEYLNNDVEKLMLISQKIKDHMKNESEFEYFDDFKGISGNERYYVTDLGELVVIFDAGVVAPEEHGEIYINVGDI